MSARGPLGAPPLDEPFVPARDATEASVFQCGLCGLRFSHGERACGSCALGAGCDLVRCPGCGYQFPRDSRLLRWLKRLAGGGRSR